MEACPTGALIRNEFGDTRFKMAKLFTKQSHRIVSESGRIELNLSKETLGDFPLFIALADVAARRPPLRTATIAGFAAVGLTAAVAFSRAVWIS